MPKKPKKKISVDSITVDHLEILYEKYINTLKKYVNRTRFRHSLEVANLAYRMAIYYEYHTPDFAYLAGLLHDIAKDMSFEDHLNIANKYEYKYSACEIASPATLHAPISMLLAEHELGIKDEEILTAIQFHTTGKANMTMLEKIVYLADIVEAGKRVEHGLRVKKLVYSNIDAALCLTAKETLKLLLDKEKVICEKSLECYNFYLQQGLLK